MAAVENKMYVNNLIWPVFGAFNPFEGISGSIFINRKVFAGDETRYLMRYFVNLNNDNN
jgi:hypothetical protein